MRKYPLKNILRERRRKAEIKGLLKNCIRYLCLCLFLFCTAELIIYGINRNRHRQEAEEIRKQKNEAAAEYGTEDKMEYETEYGTEDGMEYETEYKEQMNDRIKESVETEEIILPPPVLPDYRELYSWNTDMVGWLCIGGTSIDYPVMQTPEDENYYLYRDFYKEKDSNGCLIMDTDSTVGSGTAACEYKDGTKPSTNLIIHGHTMKSGAMFGNLKLYADEMYGMEHSVICFDSLYEKREYELLAVFYSQVYYKSDDVFKYYNFFQADTQEEFDYWYENIKKMSLYDTGVNAELGDEFITLSCCSYHTEDGRFVVVGRRVK